MEHLGKEMNRFPWNVISVRVIQTDRSREVWTQPSMCWRPVQRENPDPQMCTSAHICILSKIRLSVTLRKNNSTAIRECYELAHVMTHIIDLQVCLQLEKLGKTSAYPGESNVIHNVL